MKNGVEFLSSLLFLLITTTACVDKSSKPSSPQNGDRQKFVKIIPKPRNGKLNYSYMRIQEYLRQLKLNSIENGFDSMFIRIWYHSNDTIQILDFKNENGAWIGEYHTLKRDENKDSIINMTTEKKCPKSGWPIFIENLFSLKIMTLPDFSELPIYDIPMGGLFMDVEIATTAQYRIYTYGIPYEPTHIKEVTNIENIMKLIETEFNIPTLNKDYFR